MIKEEPQGLLLYWSPETAEDVLRREKMLDYATSDQFWRVKPGDTVWIVTVGKGELFLLGKLHVGDITNRIGAIQILGQGDMWGDKKYYAIAAPNTVEPLRKISLANIVGQLSFESKRSKNLKLGVGNRVNAQQLQTMRLLDASSTGLLQRIWATQ